MPNINFSAPVIRLGTTGPSKPTSALGESGHKDSRGDTRGGRAGLGASDGSRGGRDNLAALVPPTKDEVLRTIFVGGITEGAGGDEGIERMLRCAGNLRRWSRAMDADDKACRFGFAEYEDPDSLSTAIDVLKNVEVPVKPQSVKEGAGDEDDETVEKSALLVSLLFSSPFDSHSLDIPRSSLMMGRWIIWISIVRHVETRIRYKPSYVSMRRKANLLPFYGISRTLQKLFKRTTCPKSMPMAIRL